MLATHRIFRLAPLAAALALAWAAPGPSQAQTLGAPNSCEWKQDMNTTGPLQQARAWASATPLEYGDVLVTGGADPWGNVFGSAEVFVASLGSFVATATPMTTPRAGHTSTRLMDGQVLIVGGHTTLTASGQLTNQVEVYNPATRQFRGAAPLAIARSGHSATLLQTGEVMVIGGVDAFGRWIADIEIFDPATGSFRHGGKLGQARGGHTATQRALSPGIDEVLVIGGGGPAGALDSIEHIAYDSAQRVPVIRSLPAGLGTARASHTATRLPDGSILVAGGVDFNGQPLDSLEVVGAGPAALARPAGRLLGPRAGHQATGLATGQVLFSGGSKHFTQAAAEAVELYDGSATTRLVGTLREPRIDAVAAELPLGQVLIAGGATTAPYGPATTSELYDPFWGGVGTLREYRAGHTTTLLPGSQVLVAGGDANGAAHGTAELFSVWTGRSERTFPLQQARTGHRATRLPGGQVVLTGGAAYVGGGPSNPQQVEWFDPVGGAFVAGPTMTPRLGHEATALPDGRVLLSGGIMAAPFAGAEHDSTEFLALDPVRSIVRLSPGPRMPAARQGHAATLLPGGSDIVFSGGKKGSGIYATVDLLNTTSWQFRSARSTGVPEEHRTEHASVALPSGVAMLVGGRGWASPTETIDIVPGGGLSKMTQSRLHLALVPRVGNGYQFWAIGGQTAGAGGALDSVEEIDAANGTVKVRPVPPMDQGRTAHTATLLPDGRVLVVGGRGGAGASVLVSKSTDCRVRTYRLPEGWRWPRPTVFPWRDLPFPRPPEP